MARIPYTKRPLPVVDQIHLLEEKGMEFHDKRKAVKQLASIGYYRFTGYAYPFRNPTDNSSFVENTSFEKVISIYEFDRKLKSLLFNCIERIEIAFRAQIIDRFSLSAGSPFWFCDRQYFINEEEYRSFLAKLNSELDNSQEEFIIHFQNHYNDTYPPAWITLQLLSFGGLINLFRNFNQEEPKSQIHQFFGCESLNRFISWINTLVYIRNICGHHARLWNIAIKKQPLAYHFGDKKTRRDNTTYYTVCFIKSLLDEIEPDNILKEELQALFAKNTYADAKKETYIGFPPKWDTDCMW